MQKTRQKLYKQKPRRMARQALAAVAVVLCAVFVLSLVACADLGKWVSTGRPTGELTSPPAPSSSSSSKAAPSDSGQDRSSDAATSSGEVVDTSGLETFSLADVPAFSGELTAEINGNVPFFEIGNDASASMETYSPLDSLGRCATAVALVGEDIMPTEPRGSIGNVRPTGWHNAKYDWVDGKYVYNRCHLIAYQLSGENANECNLITGTRSMNVKGMMPYENRVGDYVHQTGNHVYYRVTPLFAGDDLVARGVLMEAESVEDAGAGVRFCVWCYNVEPGVEIDYATGENHAAE